MRVFKTHKALEAALDRKPKARGSFRFLPDYMPAGFICSDCGETKPFKLGGGTGYGTDSADNMFCYACGAKRCAADLERDGKGILYLTGGKPGDAHGSRLTDWTGELSINVRHKQVGRHNFARRRYDVWFRWNGAEWHGVQYGDNTQICHVRRLKGVRP